MEHILSLSYGKDSLESLRAITKSGLPLDRIIHAEIWATDTIPADLPPMVEFKAKADMIIKERYGIYVEHVKREQTYNRCFYKEHFYKTNQIKFTKKMEYTGFRFAWWRGAIQG